MRLKLTVLFLISLLAFQSCDYLDKTPDEDLTIDDVFTREEWIRGFLSNIYSWLPHENHFADDGHYRNPYIGACDEMEIAFGAAYSHLMNAGTWNSSNISRVPVWADAWCAVRTCNIFLEHIDAAPIDPENIKVYKGEVYFLRAFYHFLTLSGCLSIIVWIS